MHAAYPDDRLLRFDPARKQESSYLITHGASEAGLVETQTGLLLAGGSASHGISDRLTWLEWRGATGIEVFQGRQHQAREAPAMIALPDHSVWVVGGTIGYTTSSGGSQLRVRSNAVDRVWQENGMLRVEALPDVPGPPRWGMRVVALADGRVLALGGTSSEFIGCNQCLAESHLFEPSTGVWQRGPDLLSARADASASLLPDGRVLVAGGWTEVSGWSDGGGPSASTEFYLPERNVFVAGPNMPGGNAGQQAIWLPWAPGKLLLTSGGASPLLNLYEVDQQRWRSVAGPCEPLGAGHGIPYLAANAPATSRATPTLIVGPGRIPLAIEPLPLNIDDAVLRCTPRQTTVVDTPGVSTRALYRTAAFGNGVANSTASPALIAVGGRTPQSLQNSMLTGAVDAIDRAGLVHALPTLTEQRDDALVFALGPSLLVVGGNNHRGSRDYVSELPLEWLPDWRQPKASWAASRRLFRSDTAYAVDSSQANAATLIVVASDGTAARVSLPPSGSALDAAPLLTQDLPRLTRARQQARVRALVDGRIVVAGGRAQAERVAVADTDASGAVLALHYEGFGSFVPADNFEVFEPSAHTWRESAAAPFPGETAVIVEDGRVVVLGQRPASDSEQATSAIQLSHVDGSGWSLLDGGLPEDVRISERSRLLLADGELLLVAEAREGGEHRPVLLRLEGLPSTAEVDERLRVQWLEIWRGALGLNWRDHVGRVIRFQLPNGEALAIGI